MNVTIVWVDRTLAKIYHFSDDRMVRETVRAPSEPETFYFEIANHLRSSRQILVLSPDGTGEKLATGLRTFAPRIGSRIVGCEPLGDPDDAAIADYAIRYFRKPIRPTGT